MKRPTNTETVAKSKFSTTAGSVDQHVSQRIRHRRILMGFTQHQLADLIGVTYQQAHKYEKGINRISAGRLYQIAQALGVAPSYFFEGSDPGNVAQPTARELVSQQRMLLEMARNFSSLKRRENQEVICHMARALSRSD